jgi:hypothetical protein
MAQKPIKEQYVTPTLKEHGIVRELTQTGSGGRPHKDKDKGRGWHWKWKWHWPW